MTKKELFVEFLGKVGDYLMKCCEKHADNIAVNRGISDEIFLKMNQSIEDYRRHEKGNYELSPVKKAAILCFWVKKLKPYHIEDDTVSPDFKVNEACALLAAKIVLKLKNGGQLVYKIGRASCRERV